MIPAEHVLGVMGLKQPLAANVTKDPLSDRMLEALQELGSEGGVAPREAIRPIQAVDNTESIGLTAPGPKTSRKVLEITIPSAAYGPNVPTEMTAIPSSRM